MKLYFTIQFFLFNRSNRPVQLNKHKPFWSWTGSIASLPHGLSPVSWYLYKFPENSENPSTKYETSPAPSLPSPRPPPPPSASPDNLHLLDTSAFPQCLPPPFLLFIRLRGRCSSRAGCLPSWSPRGQSPRGGRQQQRWNILSLFPSTSFNLLLKAGIFPSFWCLIRAEAAARVIL